MSTQVVVVVVVVVAAAVVEHHQPTINHPNPSYGSCQWYMNGK